MPPEALPSLVAELRRITEAHPYDRKLLLCASPAEGRELLRALALQGCAWVGWESWSLRQLAHQVVGLQLAAEGLGTADGFDVMAAVDEAIDAADSASETELFEGGVPGSYRDPIRRTVEALRLAGLGAEAMAAAAGRDAKLRLLATVLSRYEDTLIARNLLDGPGLMARAAAALESGPDDSGVSAGTDGLPAALLFLLPGLTLRGVEGRLLRSLLDRGARVLATDPVAGLQAPASLLWAASPETAGPLSVLHDPEPAVPERGPHAGCAGDGSPGPPVALFAAATPTDELKEVLRRVVAAGAPCDEVEIVATDPTTYGMALDGLARRLGIPVTYSEGLPLSRTRAGRAADAYFRWVSDGFSVDPIRQLLESGDLAASDTGPSAAALARRLRRLHIGWGHDRYLATLDRVLAAAEQEPRATGDDDERLEAARERERTELVALRGLLAPILAATPRPEHRRADWRDRTSPAALAEGLLALLERVPGGDEVENTARTVLVHRLERARATLTRDTGWTAATAVLRSRLETRISATAAAGRLAPWTSTGGHLHLSGIARGGLAARPHTFVVGLSAGAVGAGLVDPLLTDPDRVRLNGLNRNAATGPGAPVLLPGTADRIHEAKHALAAMLARLRGRITLSYAAWDMSEGRTIGPAPELLQSLRLLEGDRALTYEDLRKRLGRLACAVPDPAKTGAGLLDGADVWLTALAMPDGRLRDGSDTVRSAHPGLDRGLQAQEARTGACVTVYHGLVRPEPGLDPRAAGEVVSASRLESLGSCPLRYFYRYVLGIRPVRDPSYDPERWLDALERGSLLHDVYELTLEHQPPGVAYDDGAFLDHALAVLDEQVRRMLQRLPAPNTAVFRSERDALEADVRSFVAMVRDQRPNVLRTELAFGPDRYAEGEVQVEVGERPLRLRGRVDRLDALEAGGLRIVDYKTGQARAYHADFPFHGGRRLQHLLYSLAVERLRPGERVEAAEYHFPSVRGENQIAGYARAALAAGEDVVDTLLGIARQGRFLATTEPNDCAFCDFHAPCRVTVGDWNNACSPRAVWAKANAEGLDEYRPLVRLRAEYGAGS